MAKKRLQIRLTQLEVWKVYAAIAAVAASWTQFKIEATSEPPP